MTTSIPENPDKLLKKKWKYRQTVRQSEAHGLQVTVPSYWAKMRSEDGTYTLFRALDNDKLGQEYERARASFVEFKSDWE